MKYICSENIQKLNGDKCDDSIQCPVYEDDRCCCNCPNVSINCGLKCAFAVKEE